MSIALLGSLSGMLLGWLMGFLSLFLILLILIQRGKGGGLSGALGGPGGQSAFGSKAGDTFTVITVVVASIWGFTCAFTMWLLGTHAPPAITDASMTAGPGDDNAADGLVVPPMDGGQAGSLSDGIGLSGIGEANGDAADTEPEADGDDSEMQLEDSATESSDATTEESTTEDISTEESTDSETESDTPTEQAQP